VGKQETEWNADDIASLRELIQSASVLREILYGTTVALDTVLDAGAKSRDKEREWEGWDTAQRFQFFKEKEFRSSDVIKLVAEDLYGHRYLEISAAAGVISIGCILDYVLLRALAQHAITSPGEFVRIPDLLDEVSDIAGLTTLKGNSLSDVLDENALRKTIWRLRAAIRRTGRYDEIIETAGEKGGGYRLSVPPWNVILIDPPGLRGT